jgi:hypothetical protein
MKTTRMMLSVAAAMTLTGCSMLEPFATYPRQPEAKTHDAGPRVAICYDALVSATAVVQHAAQQECSANSVATRVDTDWVPQYCPVLLPARATFVCAPKAKK